MTDSKELSGGGVPAVYPLLLSPGNKKDRESETPKPAEDNATAMGKQQQQWMMAAAMTSQMASEGSTAQQPSNHSDASGEQGTPQLQLKFARQATLVIPSMLGNSPKLPHPHPAVSTTINILPTQEPHPFQAVALPGTINMTVQQGQQQQQMDSVVPPPQGPSTSTTMLFMMTQQHQQPKEDGPRKQQTALAAVASGTLCPAAPFLAKTEQGKQAGGCVGPQMLLFLLGFFTCLTWPLGACLGLVFGSHRVGTQRLFWICNTVSSFLCFVLLVVALAVI